MSDEDFSKYMNKPECPVEVGNTYYRNDSLEDNIEYTVLEIIEKDNKFYARCSFIDPFDNELAEETVYCFYLTPKRAL